MINLAPIILLIIVYQIDSIRLELHFDGFPGVILSDFYVFIKHLVFPVLDVDGIIGLIDAIVVYQLVFAPSTAALEWLHRITKK